MPSSFQILTLLNSVFVLLAWLTEQLNTASKSQPYTYSHGWHIVEHGVGFLFHTLKVNAQFSSLSIYLP